jgi:NAD(P)-dependent dehydrogenase (short-subunit alcohol dehydrogenase family)
MLAAARLLQAATATVVLRYPFAATASSPHPLLSSPRTVHGSAAACTASSSKSGGGSRREQPHVLAGGPVYVLFGATGGVGSALARRLAAAHAAGAPVAPAALLLSARERGRLEKLAAELAPLLPKGQVVAAPADALNPEAVRGRLGLPSCWDTWSQPSCGRPAVAALAIASPRSWQPRSSSKLSIQALEPLLAPSCQVEGALHTALHSYGRVDGVACCIGDVEAASLLATPLAELDRALRANLHTAFNVLRASVKVQV